MKIIKYGLNSRHWFRAFEELFYSKLAPELKPTYTSSREFLGRSFSFFIFEHKNIRNLCMFDVDDGSGLLEDSCQINYSFLDKIIEENNVNDYMIFKAQCSKQHPYCNYYKDIDKTVPLGYFPDRLEDILKIKKKIKKKSIFSKSKTKDIDIFWIGSVIYDMGEGMVWMPERHLKYWNYGKRIAGFKALQEIAKRRKDIKIICTDKKVPFREYLDLMSRSKICFDFPGVGEFTKRFIECLNLEKCVMSFLKHQEMNFELKPNIHYLSIDIDDDINYSYSNGPSNWPNSFTYNNLNIDPKQSLIDKINNRIDDVLNNIDLIENIEKNVKEIQEFLTPDSTISYIKENALNYFFPS